MTLREYYEKFHQLITGELGGDFTTQVAAEVAAGYETGLGFEQLKRFLACRTEITSVAVALKGATLSVAEIERILEARRNGAAYPKAVLCRAFAAEEVREKFHAEVFGAPGPRDGA